MSQTEEDCTIDAAEGNSVSHIEDTVVGDEACQPPLMANHTAADHSCPAAASTTPALNVVGTREPSVEVSANTLMDRNIQDVLDLTSADNPDSGQSDDLEQHGSPDRCRQSDYVVPEMGSLSVGCEDISGVEIGPSLQSFLDRDLPTRAEEDDSLGTRSGKSENSTDDDGEMMEAVDLRKIYSGLQLVDTWRPVRELRRRELGGNRQKFVRQAGGSIDFVRRFKNYTTLDGHSGCVNALHFNESGTLLASGSDDLNIVVWKWTESKSFFTFDSGHRSNVFQCKFMPFTGDCHLVSCAREGHVRLAELSSTGTCKRTKKLAQHRGAAHKLALLSDSSHVFYSCGEDGVVFQIDLREDKPNKLCTTKENNHLIELYSIHSNPFKSFEYCVAGRDHFVRIYDVRKIAENDSNNGLVHKYCPEHLTGNDLKANITCAVYNYNGTEVLASYNDEDIYLFDCTNADLLSTQFLHRYTGHRNNATVKGVNFYGPRSEFVVSGSDCGNVFLWDRQSEAIVNYFHADEGGVINVLEPHPSMPVLATSGLDHDIKVWMPTADEPTGLKDLDKVASRNKRERETERNTDPDIDSHVLWMLMQHLRRSRRRYMHNLAHDPDDPASDDDATSSSSSEQISDNDGNDAGDNDADNGNNDNNNDDDDDRLPVATVRCNPS